MLTGLIASFSPSRSCKGNCRSSNFAHIHRSSSLHKRGLCGGSTIRAGASGALFEVVGGAFWTFGLCKTMSLGLPMPQCERSPHYQAHSKAKYPYFRAGRAKDIRSHLPIPNLVFCLDPFCIRHLLSLSHGCQYWASALQDARIIWADNNFDDHPPHKRSKYNRTVLGGT